MQMMQDADFIVVGGGTAGCVMAAALSEKSDTRVLLLEAGGAPTSPAIAIPAAFSKLFRSRWDWAFSTTPQTPAQRRIFVPRGRVLGGCSALNAQIHQWGHPLDFDMWRECGADGWGWEDVAPVFRRNERFIQVSDGRGSEGPLPVAPLASPQPQSLAFVEALRRLNGSQEPMYNGAAYEGAWISEVNHSHGRRVSAYDAWLKPALSRPNLRVETDATVLSILFDGKRATGLRFARDGREFTMRARRGVILCAGAIGSPHILMCSGVGPAAELAAHGIPVVHEAKGVGANLHDHPMVCATFATRSARSLKSAQSIANLFSYVARRRGMLASNVAEAVAFLRTSPTEKAPDLELLFAPVEWRDEGLQPPRVHGFTIAAIALSPASRGSVGLASPDVRTAPRIDPALLSDSGNSDRSTLEFGLDLARQVALSPPLSEDCAREISPGPSCTTPQAKQNWLNEAVQTVYHPAGTCRIGTDGVGVVGPRLAVHGTQGLWVADASVMPAVPRGHPNAAVAMIAQRGAGFITHG